MVIATPLGHCIQFCSYADKDSILQEYENMVLGALTSVVENLVCKLPVTKICNYHIAINN